MTPTGLGQSNSVRLGGPRLLFSEFVSARFPGQRSYPMRLFAHCPRRGPIRSGLIAVLLAMNWALVSRAQDADSKPDTKGQPEETLTVGTEVVVARTGCSVTNRERLAQTAFPPPYVVDRLLGDRVLISSHSGKRKQWTSRAQIIAFKTAIEDRSSQIAKDPGSARAWAQRAQLWADHGDDDRARADLDIAIRAEPDEPWLYVRRSTILLRQKQLDQALADCDRAIELAPNNVLAFLNRAKAWVASNDHDRAMADLSESVRLDPTNPSAWAERSRLWLFKREPDRATSDIDEAIRLAPDDASLRSWRGKCQAARGDHDQAIAEYSEAIRLDPDHAPGLEDRARAYLGKGEFDRVIADTTKGIQLEPRRLDLYLLRGNAWYRKHEYDRAVDDDTSAIRLDPKHAFSYACRAGAWRTKKRAGDKQIDDYSAAIELEPHKRGLSRLSRQHVGSTGKARAGRSPTMTNAVRLEPNKPELYVYRGIEREKLRQEGVIDRLSSAAADFDRSSEIDPTYADAYLQRSRIWYWRREFVKIVREFENAHRAKSEPCAGTPGARLDALASCERPAGFETAGER